MLTKQTNFVLALILATIPVMVSAAPVSVPNIALPPPSEDVKVNGSWWGFETYAEWYAVDLEEKKRQNIEGWTRLAILFGTIIGVVLLVLACGWLAGCMARRRVALITHDRNEAMQMLMGDVERRVQPAIYQGVAPKTEKKVQPALSRPLESVAMSRGGSSGSNSTKVACSELGDLKHLAEVPLTPKIYETKSCSASS